MASIEKVNKIKALKMLDIGAGDCHMTQRVGVKLNAKPTPIDLAGSNKEMWKGHVAEVSKGPEVIYYDGVNLISAVEQDTNGFQSLYDVVTFNHVLHHYPNRDAQIQGLQRTVALMKEGGVILFSEHASILADEQIELQHVLFDLKDATNKVMGQNPALAFELLGTLSDETHLKYEKEKGRATYFSRPLLERLTKVCGLTPIVSKTRTNEEDYDASHTVITGFIKTSPTMTPEEVKFFQPKTLAQLTDNGELKAFEDTDACGFKLSNTEQGKFFQSSKSIQPSHASVDSNGFYYLSTKL